MSTTSAPLIDSRIMLRRNLKHILRNPTTIFNAALMPVVIMLLLVYVPWAIGRPPTGDAAQKAAEVMAPAQPAGRQVARWNCWPPTSTCPSATSQVSASYRASSELYRGA